MCFSFDLFYFALTTLLDGEHDRTMSIFSAKFLLVNDTKCSGHLQI